MNISKIFIYVLAVSVLFTSLWGCAEKEDRSVDQPHQLTIQLTRSTKYSRINFDDAYTMVWAGNVTAREKTVGEFTAELTKTTETGQNGAIIQYDIIVPIDGPIGEFISIRTNHITNGDGADHGVVFATSPEYRFLLGAIVKKKGIETTIRWETGSFPSGSPLAE